MEEPFLTLLLLFLALFPGAFNCCTKISDEIPKGILPRVERFEIQKADGLCHLEAVMDRKFCVSPQIKRVKKWMKKKKHKTAGKKTHGRKQRRTSPMMKIPVAYSTLNRHQITPMKDDYSIKIAFQISMF
uniref:Chemokine interleukin-8-like domain-containing protein n=1 Tax=Cairina moschata TaxID=8855 RepID=A0A8C3BFS3_CAIMO